MKKIPFVLACIVLLLPSISFAAALTTQQASSLIAVVQSSPGTPASAFTSLITAFSNITVTQADSLITVVQAAPGVAPSAFINLLTSFTVDTAAQPTQQQTSPPVNQNAQTISSLQAEMQTYQTYLQSDEASINEMNAEAASYLSQGNCSSPAYIGEGNSAIAAQAAGQMCRAYAQAANAEYQAEAPVNQQISFYQQEIAAIQQKIYSLQH